MYCSPTMADSKLPLSPASPGGQIEDVENLVVPDPGLPPAPPPGFVNLVRQRIQIVGRLYTQIAAVLNADPAPNEFGLVTRNIPSGLQSVAITDGVDGPAAVTPAATSPTVADPALVVTISPNSGAIMASDASVAPTNGPVPGSTQQNGGTDGTDIRANHMFDLDTGAGEEWNLGVSLRLAAPGGSVEGGTSANPLRIDPTGTTTQPVSAASLPLPAGAATEATVASILAQLDVALSTRASEATVAAILAGLAAALDVPLSTRASEVTVASILAQLDVALSTRASAANQTTLGAQTTKINDGTNTAAVKAASTAPLATDPALVVTLSPNSSPTGTQDVNLTQVAGNAVTTQAAGEQLVAVEGRAANGAAVTGNPVLSGGTDGVNARTFLTDTSGRQQVVGAAAQGAAVAGNPVLTAGEDATGNVSRLQTRVAQPARTDAGLVARTLPSVVGTHANAWNNVAVAAGGNSTAIDTEFTPHVTIFGNSSGTTTIRVQVSQDNVNFYQVSSFNVPGGGDFGFSATLGARYVRLQSSAARTITATIAGKD